MTCISCNGTTSKKTAKFIVDLERCVLIVKNVPAFICQQCGAQSYSDEVAGRLEAISDAIKTTPVQEVAIVDYLDYEQKTS